MSPVELTLDLRGYNGACGSAEELQALWARVEAGLSGHVLPPGRRISVGLEGEGKVLVEILDGPGGPVGADTPFAIHGLLERPRGGTACAQCGEARGLHRCARCRPSDRYCDSHAVFLDGVLEGTCSAHRPACKGCGAPGTFRCDGFCVSSWCNSHRKPHPTDPDRSYCPACHEELFAACSEAGCRNLGTHRCEWFDLTTGRMCGRRICRSHTRQWAVYPPTEERGVLEWRDEGLGRCPAHRTASPRDGAEIVTQVILGTAARQVRRGKAPRLPSLGSTRHTVINTLSWAPSFEQAFAWWEGAGQRLAGDPAIVAAAGRSLPGQLKRLRDEYERMRPRLERMRQLLAAAQAALRARGQSEIADQLAASDWNDRHNVLYVRLPEPLIARFIGTGGQNIRAIGAAIGCALAMEKELRRDR